MTKPVKNQTYNRIIDASLQLFNEQGERNISTNHIATHLSMSPGNLYYYFANKDEIIVQLFKRYTKEVLHYLTQTPLPRDMREAFGYLEGVYRVMWDYRFLFSDVNALLVRSNDLLGEHNEFTRKQIAPLLLKLLNQLNDLGIIQADELDRKNLATNMWIVTKYWFDFDSSLQGRARITETTKIRGIGQTLSMMRPYLTASHRAVFDELMGHLEENS